MENIDLLELSFLAFSVFISFLDIKNRAVPRIMFVLALLFFIIVKINQTSGQLLISITGFLVGLIIFLLAWFLSKKRLGLADICYSSIIGLVLGINSWYTAIGIACITGLLFIW